MYWGFSPEWHYKNILSFVNICLWSDIVQKSSHLQVSPQIKCILKDALSLFDEAEVRFQRKLKLYRRGKTFNFTLLLLFECECDSFYPRWRKTSFQIWSTHKNHLCFFSINKSLLSKEAFHINSNYLDICLETF